ncbi:DinB family protein [Flexithrix dorotheae]|uniref:DinB family protein n=1 Tax=Flexithrix dorotheae TaxID=70993 RepID=UPI0012F7C08D|nr:DinB family protein [Flexithrix dorotheae]
MVNIANVILQIEKELISTFSAIDEWFEKPEELLRYAPKSAGWTVFEILDHIYLANHYYLNLIEKGKERALKNQLHINWKEELLDYEFDKPGMDGIGIWGSFPWETPGYLKPSIGNDLVKIKGGIGNQLQHCFQILKALPNGEGLACKTLINVNNLGIVDVYQYLWFLIKHAQRHLYQMKNNENEAFQFQTQKSI